MVVDTFNTNTQEAEADRCLPVQDHNEALSQKKIKSCCMPYSMVSPGRVPKD